MEGGREGGREGGNYAIIITFANLIVYIIIMDITKYKIVLVCYTVMPYSLLSPPFCGRKSIQGNFTSIKYHHLGLLEPVCGQSAVHAYRCTRVTSI